MKTLKFPAALALALFLLACGSPEERAAGHLVKAEELLEADDLVKAKLEAQNAAQIEPRNAQARMLLAKIAEKEGNFREAIGHLLVAVDSDPNFVEPRVRLGNYYFLGRATEQAAEQSEAAMALAPEDADVRLLNARVKFLEGDREAAARETDVALAKDPALVDAIMFKAGLAGEREAWEEAFAIVEDGIARVPTKEGQPLRQFRVQLLQRTGRADEIEVELQSLTRDFPDVTAYKYALVQYYAQQERPDDAETLLREIAAEEPTDVERQLTLTRYLAQQKGFDAAEEFLSGMVKSQPELIDLQLALGNLYEANKQTEEAEAIYQKAADQAPISEAGLKARNRIVALHIADNDLERARADVEKILTDVPDDTNALLYRAAFEFVDEKYDAAISDLRVLLRKEESSERGLLLLARSYVRSGDAVLAQDAYRRLLAINPKHPNAPGELAALLAQQGDTAEAEEVLRARLEVDPSDEAAASGLIQTLIAQQDLEGAETEARKLVDLNENNAMAQFQLGRVLQARESPDEAIAAYKATLAENPAATGALQGLVSVLVQNGRSMEAIGFLQDYRKDNPDQALDARFLEGSVKAGLGDKAAASQDFEAILEQAPQANRVYIALAGLEKDGSPERVAVLQRGFDAIPGNPQLGLLLASAHERLSQWDEAIAVYEELVSGNAENVIALNNLAALLLDQRDDADSHARALELAQGLRETEQPAFLDTVGWAYYRNADYTNAVRYLERAVAAAGEVPILRYHLGMAYAANNNPFGAKQELGRAIEEAKTEFAGIEEARAKLAELNAS